MASSNEPLAESTPNSVGGAQVSSKPLCVTFVKKEKKKRKLHLWICPWILQNQANSPVWWKPAGPALHWFLRPSRPSSEKPFKMLWKKWHLVWNLCGDSHHGRQQEESDPQKNTLLWFTQANYTHIHTHTVCVWVSTAQLSNTEAAFSHFSLVVRSVDFPIKICKSKISPKPIFTSIPLCHSNCVHFLPCVALSTWSCLVVHCSLLWFVCSCCLRDSADVNAASWKANCSPLSESCRLKRHMRFEFEGKKIFSYFSALVFN